MKKQVSTNNIGQKDIVWYPRRQASTEVSVAENLRVLVPLIQPRPKKPSAGADDWIFTGADLGLVGSETDQLGYPAVMFEMKPEKQNAFGDFTGSNINRGMAIVMNGEIVTRGKTHGIATPWNARIVDTVWDIAKGRIKSSRDTLDRVCGPDDRPSGAAIS